MTDAIVELSGYARDTLVALCRDRFVDAVHGGFHERLTAQLDPVVTGRKRLMVQARQLYVLSHAAVLGDRSGADAAHRGWEFLLRHFRDRSNGGWYFSVTPEGDKLDGGKDLYALAFLLFALSWMQRAFAPPGALDLAAETLDMVRAKMALPDGGYHASAAADWTPAPGSLVQNPHMHLFEAVLALDEASPDPVWKAEAETLARLFTDKLFHPTTGTIREFFGKGWAIDPARGAIVEPGHQFEWVWLLDRYRRQGGSVPVGSEITALFRFAKTHGFDEQHGGIHDHVDPSGAPTAPTRRIWPVAEALKAFVVMSHTAESSPAEADRLARHLLTHFLKGDGPGWHETLTRDGVPTMSELPGSTPYHIFLAAIEAEALSPVAVGPPS